MKLTLRDLFWLVLVAALVLAWWLDRSRLSSEVERLGASKKVRLDGVVLAVSPARRLVEVSFGSDDGAQRGDLLEVHRGNVKVGEVQIVEVEPDRSVGRISNQRGPLQGTDRVTLWMDPPDMPSRQASPRKR